MAAFTQPCSLGKLKLSNNIMFPALSGCSDVAYRKIVREYNPGLIFCEMVKMQPLIRGCKGTMHYLDYTEDMHPIGAQIVGSDPSLAGESAKIIEDKGFDILDFNCGCPVDKVTRDGSGSAMLKTPEMIGDIIASMVNAVKIPVTVKIRSGWDESDINAGIITRLAEDAGAVAITVHGRTRVQGYSGGVNYDWIRMCKEAAKNILVFGNGDIVDGPSAKRMFDETGCDGIAVARGTFGNPWIADDILRYMNDGVVCDHSPEERRNTLMRHFTYMLENNEERRAVLEMRRVACWYFKRLPHASDFRGVITKAVTAAEVWDIIERYSYEQ